MGTEGLSFDCVMSSFDYLMFLINYRKKLPYWISAFLLSINSLSFSALTHLKVYIAEVSPARVRGALGNINQVSINFGFVLSYTLGYR